MVKWILSSLLGIAAVSASAQHTPLTSQYLFNGLLINPAYAGSRDALAANLTWRNQWVGFEGAPETQVLSVHAPLNRRKMGLGVLAYNDRIGVSRETGFFANYAYRIKFKKGKLSLGLGGGVTLLKAQWTDVNTTQAGDASFTQDTRSSLKPNFSAGAFYYKKKFFMGASVPFFISHRYSPDRNAYTVTNDVRQYQPMITGGYVFNLTRKMKLKPSALMRYQIGAAVQGDLNVNLIFSDKVWLGASYRSGDAVVGMLEVLPKPQLRLGYSYDLGISDITPYHSGTHELMLQYEFGYRIKIRDPRYF